MLTYKNVVIVFFSVLAGLFILDYVVMVPLWIYFCWLVLCGGVIAYGSTVLSASFFLPVKFKGDETSQQIAITFDDGPLPMQTEKILDILKRYETPAAFFCIGHRIDNHPDVIKRMHAEGHVVGNHSYWHGKTFDLQWASTIKKELSDTDLAIHHLIGVRPRFFRPPYGVTNPMVANAAKQKPYVIVGWSVRSLDTVVKDGKALLMRITKSLKGGDIVLFHDYSETMIEILPAFLEHVSKRGLKIVRLDELLNEHAYD